MYYIFYTFTSVLKFILQRERMEEEATMKVVVSLIAVVAIRK